MGSRGAGEIELEATAVVRFVDPGLDRDAVAVVEALFGRQLAERQLQERGGQPAGCFFLLAGHEVGDPVGAMADGQRLERTVDAGLVTLLWAWRFPSLSRMDRFPKAPIEPT